jgi:hypothetical protein
MGQYRVFVAAEIGRNGQQQLIRGNASAFQFLIVGHEQVHFCNLRAKVHVSSGAQPVGIKPRSHYLARSVITQDSPAFFQLHHAGKDFCGRGLITVH